MDNLAAVDGLTHGLRALSLLATRAPLTLKEFGALAKVPLVQAEQMLGIFEQAGYVTKVPFGALYVLAPEGLRPILHENPSGDVVTRAIRPLSDLALETGAIISLSIRRGPTMLRCLSSSLHQGAAPPGTVSGLIEGTVGLVQVACSHSGALDQMADVVRRRGYAAEVVEGSGCIAVPVYCRHQEVAVLAADFQAFDRDSQLSLRL